MNWYNYVACFFAGAFLAMSSLTSFMAFLVTASRLHPRSRLDVGCLLPL